jgi:hypothetical protein
MHLGDNKSPLNNPAIVAKVVTDLANFTGPEVGTLVLNGDVWEQCIPAGTLEEDPGDGFCSSVSKASRLFFGDLFKKILVGNIVWVPGNHDLSLWKRLSDSSGLPFHTKSSGESLLPSMDAKSKKFFDSLLGIVNPSFKVAYPLFLESKSEPADFPYVLFSHGHLMDALVRGEEQPDAVYLALRALGCRRPYLPPDPSNILSISQIAASTDDFTLSLWKQDSAVDYTFWNEISRRLAHPGSCALKGKGSQAVTRANHPTSPRDGLMPSVRDFLEVALTDASLPTPVGSLRSAEPSPSFTKPSCFVYGHDHLGTAAQVMACGVPFQVFDSGGWTVEFDGHVPHSHALVWYDDNITPCYAYLSLT